MTDSNHLFGTSGIRGDAINLFSDQFSFDLGRAFAIFLARHEQRGAITIGRDPRDSSPRISSSVASGVVFEKRILFDQGIVPIPSINYILTKDSSISGGIMISGSHIKKELNGIKFFAFGREILKSHEQEIADIYTSLKEKVGYKNLSDQFIPDTRAKSFYIEYLISNVESFPLPAYKAVVDPGCGAQSEVMPEVLKKAGLDTIPINTSINENFMARDTEVEADFENLKKEVLLKKADLGIGYDSDGDRVVFVDELGNYIPGDYSGSIIAMAVKGGSVVTPINTSAVVDKIGKTVIRTKVGSPYVVQKMEEEKANFGFEANGGGIFSEMHTRDGGRSTIELLNILAKSGKSLSGLVSGLPKYFIKRDKIEYKWDLKEKIIETAKEKFQGIKVDETDGLKIWVDQDSWILFRSSANAPEFRVFAESIIETKADDLLKQGLSLVRSVIQND